METDRVLEIVERHAGERGALISILEEVQAVSGYLPAHALETVIEQGRLGVQAVDVKHDERVFPIDVACPRCNHSLMAVTHPIQGHPSIRMLMSAGTHQGWIRLSGLYGFPSFEQSDGVAVGTILTLFCPHRHGLLLGVGTCADCRAPLVPLVVLGGAILQVCSRLGCRDHSLDLSGMNA